MPKEYPITHEINCISCGYTIKHLSPEISRRLEPSNMFDNGNVGEIHAGYGSLLDGDIYLIGVCDNCLSAKGIKIGEYF